MLVGQFREILFQPTHHNQSKYFRVDKRDANGDLVSKSLIDNFSILLIKIDISKQIGSLHNGKSNIGGSSLIHILDQYRPIKIPLDKRGITIREPDEAFVVYCNECKNEIRIG